MFKQFRYLISLPLVKSWILILVPHYLMQAPLNNHDNNHGTALSISVTCFPVRTYLWDQMLTSRKKMFLCKIDLMFSDMLCLLYFLIYLILSGSVSLFKPFFYPNFISGFEATVKWKGNVILEQKEIIFEDTV